MWNPFDINAWLDGTAEFISAAFIYLKRKGSPATKAEEPFT